MKQKLIDYINVSLENVKEFIIARAELYDENIRENKERCESLFSVIDGDIVRMFDTDDTTNHNFDLGCYYTLNNVLKCIEEDDNMNI